MNTLARAACRIVENAAITTIQTITISSQVGLQEERQAGADEHAVEAEQPRPDRSAVHPDRGGGGRRRDHAERRRRSRATPWATNIAIRIASPVTGLFMKHTCPTPRRQESTKARSGLPSARSPQACMVPLTDTPPPQVRVVVAADSMARPEWRSTQLTAVLPHLRPVDSPARHAAAIVPVAMLDAPASELRVSTGLDALDARARRPLLGRQRRVAARRAVRPSRSTARSRGWTDVFETKTSVSIAGTTSYRDVAGMVGRRRADRAARSPSPRTCCARSTA